MEYTINTFADIMQVHTSSVLADLDGLLCQFAALQRESDSRAACAYKDIIDTYSVAKKTYEESALSTMAQLNDDWHQLHSQYIRMREDELRRLSADIIDWHKQVVEHKALHTIDGHLFNVFTLCNRLLGIKETTHSALLHFLLSNDELHGQGNKFLIKFLELAGIETPETGEWKITAEIGRVDVMLRREHPRSVVIVENKSNWAPDGPNQLYRYWYRNIHTCPEDCHAEYYENNNRYRIIYLAPNSQKVYSEQTCGRPAEKEFENAPERLPLNPVIWTFNNQLQEWFEQCIAVLDSNNHPIREYIRQYKEYCQTL